MKMATILLNWYRKHGRDLPWRKTRDPYHILVSEIMLQQTQVDRVRLFYDRWLTEFPDWPSLAKASNEQVVRAWAGLGYNRRALVLRDAARDIVMHGVPTTREGWKQIKGIGEYTSAALSAFAQKQRIMPIDTNIRRVLGRLLLSKPFAQPEDDEIIQKRVSTFLPMRGHFYDVPQAIFDLATDVCQKSPHCDICPLRQQCPVAKKFLANKIPIPKQMTKKAFENKHRDKPFPDRIYRGRILKLVREASTAVDPKKIGYAIDEDFDPIADEEWISNMLKRLERDGFIIRTRAGYRLKK